ncbi:MAG: hypothetical protein KF791_09215 [Verrucomicrobiae bacterium]|nr:hypothetical protein [Verrucomicrobiae bacterium]
MSNTSENGYLLIFRGTDWHKGLSPGQMQQVVGDWMAWFERLRREGRVAGGSPLENGGKVITGAGGRMVADGPFAEAKEAIGGYFLLTVKTEVEAVAIAQQCPGLPHGAIVEVRPVAGICGVAQDAGVEARHAPLAV